MAQSVANYATYSQSEWSWILGRFIVPATRLGEFEAAFATLPNQAPETPFARWRLSALPGTDVIADIARIHDFNARMADGVSGKSAVVESVELKVANVEEIKGLSEIIPPELDTYFELPWSSNGAGITAIANCGRRAKMRTGGEAADKFPAAESVIEFIRRCAAANVPFKATAGLHHPVRHFSAEANAAMHGFVNVFAAGCLSLVHCLDESRVREIVADENSAHFMLEPAGLRWLDLHLPTAELVQARGLFTSFGSCSFDEPREDLRRLHWLQD